MSFNLQGQGAIITGAARRIGLAVARRAGRSRSRAALVACGGPARGGVPGALAAERPVLRLVGTQLEKRLMVELGHRSLSRQSWNARRPEPGAAAER